MAKKSDPTRRIIQAAFDLAAERGWAGLPMADIAERAGVSLADLQAVFPTRRDILAGLGRLVDEAMLAGDDRADREEPARDRLFDRVMRRFDALQPYRAGIRRVMAELPGDPVLGFGLLPGFLRSMTWTLEAAGIPAGGMRGLARAKALGFAYVQTMRVWLEDDSPDLARTMAELDSRLRRLEELSGLMRRWTRPAASAASHKSD